MYRSNPTSPSLPPLPLSLWASQTGIVSLSLGRATGEKTEEKKDNKKRNSELFWQPRSFSFFSVFGWEMPTVDWGERHAKDTEERERERGRKLQQLQTFSMETRCWCVLLEAFGRSFPPARVRAVHKTNTPSSSVSIWAATRSDLAFNEMRRCMNSFL